VLRYTNMNFLFALSVLFVRGRTVCFTLYHCTRCWTFGIMCCIEECFDIHK